MLRRLYDWTQSLAAGRHANLALFCVAAAESSFFPFPPDIVLVPMILARPERAYYYAIVCGLSSVIGGLFGYWIGHALNETVGHWLITIYGIQGAMDSFKAWFNAWGSWVILIKGLTPIPYKIVTIACGVAGYPLRDFIFYSMISRVLRFVVVAVLLRRFGAPVQKFIEGNLELVTVAILVVVIGGIVLARYMA